MAILDSGKFEVVFKYKFLNSTALISAWCCRYGSIKSTILNFLIIKFE